MGQSLSQTLGAFDLLHSSHMWIQTILLRWKHSTTMQIRIFSRFWFFRRSRRLKINIRRTLVHFRKSHVRANKLDVQETDFYFTQFYRSWNNFSRCGFTHGWNSRSWSLGLGKRSVPFFPTPTQQHQRSSTTKLVAWYHNKQAHTKTKPRFQPSTTILIWTMLTVRHRTRSFLDLVTFDSDERLEVVWARERVGKIHARRDAMSDFSLRPYLGWRLQDKHLRPSALQSSCL